METAGQFQELHHGERLAADLCTPLARIEGSKHSPPEDHPDVIAAATDELVSTRPAPPTEEHT